MANRSDLSARVGAVLDDRRPRGEAGPLLLVTAGAVAIAVALAISAVRLAAAPAPQKEQAFQFPAVPATPAPPSAVRPSIQLAQAQPTAPEQPPPSPQKALPSPAFEVASVKQDLGKSTAAARLPYSGFLGTGGNPIRIIGNRVTVEGTLNLLIMTAYDVKDYQVVGGPTWADTDVFSIVATTGSDGAPELSQVRLMLRALLAERFQLKVHRDRKELPVYDLIVSKKTAKLKPSKAGERYGLTYDPSTPGMLRGSFTKITVADFIHLVSIWADRPVVDKTGLDGEFDYSIEWSTTSGDLKQAMMAAVQEQLGLKYVAAKEPIDCLIFDHVDKLSDN